MPSGSVEMMISSYSPRLTASWIALSGSASPTLPVTSLPRRLRQLGERDLQHALRLVDASVLGVDQLVDPVGLLGDNQVERRGSALGPLPHGIEQPRSGRRLMGDDEDVGRLWHDSPPR